MNGYRSALDLLLVGRVHKVHVNTEPNGNAFRCDIAFCLVANGFTATTLK
jgi:hypothetical protein